jgi:hypothetical protein
MGGFVTHRMLIIVRILSRSYNIQVDIIACGRVRNQGQMVLLNSVNDFDRLGRFDGLPLPCPWRNLQ